MRRDKIRRKYRLLAAVVLRSIALVMLAGKTGNPLLVQASQQRHDRVMWHVRELLLLV